MWRRCRIVLTELEPQLERVVQRVLHVRHVAQPLLHALEQALCECRAAAHVRPPVVDGDARRLLDRLHVVVGLEDVLQGARVTRLSRQHQSAQTWYQQQRKRGVGQSPSVLQPLAWLV